MSTSESERSLLDCHYDFTGPVEFSGSVPHMWRDCSQFKQFTKECFAVFISVLPITAR